MMAMCELVKNLEMNTVYILWEPGQSPVQVRFLSYRPEPYRVWVMDDEGRHIACPRDYLYTNESIPPDILQGVIKNDPLKETIK